MIVCPVLFFYFVPYVYIGIAAGFDKVSVITEPVAAAMAGIIEHRNGFDRRVNKSANGATWYSLVVDTGGGTTDYSLMKIIGSKDASDVISYNVDVVGVTGMEYFGGRDWDNVIKQHVLKLITLQIGKDYKELKAHQREIVDDWCHKNIEDIKCKLSNKERVKKKMFFCGAKYDIYINRKEIEKLLKTKMDQFEAKMKECTNGFDIDMVNVVGGSGNIPLIRQKIKETYSKSYFLIPSDIRMSVAIGAAWIAHYQQISDPTYQFNIVSAFDIGIRLTNDTMFLLLARSDPIPFIKDLKFYNHSKTKQVLLEFYTGNNHKASTNRRIGNLEFKYKSVMMPGQGSIAVRTQLTLNGKLLISVWRYDGPNNPPFTKPDEGVLTFEHSSGKLFADDQDTDWDEILAKSSRDNDELKAVSTKYGILLNELLENSNNEIYEQWKAKGKLNYDLAGWHHIISELQQYLRVNNESYSMQDGMNNTTVPALNTENDKVAVVNDDKPHKEQKVYDLLPFNNI